ncbi:MAG TPA: hypothetical protein DEA08_26335 [Planctomycetes bacterium]|nr:hypothetical protein [Planctomycetota bacterium]
MIALPFVLLAVLAALAVVTIRGRAARRRELAQPGRAPSAPLEVEDFHALEARVSRERCEACQVDFKQSGEGSRVHEGRRLRVVRLVCPRCEDERELFFQVG